METKKSLKQELIELIEQMNLENSDDTYQSVCWKIGRLRMLYQEEDEE